MCLCLFCLYLSVHTEVIQVYSYTRMLSLEHSLEDSLEHFDFNTRLNTLQRSNGQCLIESDVPGARACLCGDGWAGMDCSIQVHSLSSSFSSLITSYLTTASLFSLNIFSYNLFSYNLFSYNLFSYNLFSYNLFSYNLFSYNLLSYNLFSYNLFSYNHISAILLPLLL